MAFSGGLEVNVVARRVPAHDGPDTDIVMAHLPHASVGAGSGSAPVQEVLPDRPPLFTDGMWSPGGTLESRLSLIYPLDAPAVSPSTSHLWTKANRMIVGSIVKVVAAAT